MSTEFKLPELGENIESADVLNVLVKPGDKIEKDQGVIEIETDKATIEVPSTIEGIIKEVMVKSGDKVKVGQALIKVDENGHAQVTKPEEKQPEKKQEPQKTEVKKEEKPASVQTTKKTANEVVEMKLPELGENIESADVLTVLVKEGDFVEKDQGIIEIETDKATIEVPSAYNGKVVSVLIKSGEKAKVGQPLVKIELSRNGRNNFERTSSLKAGRSSIRTCRRS